jgi:hypothetical protein
MKPVKEKPRAVVVAEIVREHNLIREHNLLDEYSNTQLDAIIMSLEE